MPTSEIINDNQEEKLVAFLTFRKKSTAREIPKNMSWMVAGDFGCDGLFLDPKSIKNFVSSLENLEKNNYMVISKEVKDGEHFYSLQRVNGAKIEKKSSFPNYLHFKFRKVEVSSERYSELSPVGS